MSGGYTVFINPGSTIAAGAGGRPALQAFVNAGGTLHRRRSTARHDERAQRRHHHAEHEHDQRHQHAGLDVRRDAGTRPTRRPGASTQAAGSTASRATTRTSTRPRSPATAARSRRRPPSSTYAPAGDCGGPAGFGNCYGYEINANANLPGRPAVVDQPFGAGHAIMLGFDAWYRAWTTQEERLVLNGALYPKGILSARKSSKSCGCGRPPGRARLGSRRGRHAGRTRRDRRRTERIRPPGTDRPADRFRQEPASVARASGGPQGRLASRRGVPVAGLSLRRDRRRPRHAPCRCADRGADGAGIRLAACSRGSTGATVEEVLKVPGDLVGRCGLQEVLGMLRVRGLTGVLRRIKADVTRRRPPRHAAATSPQLADQQSP